MKKPSFLPLIRRTDAAGERQSIQRSALQHLFLTGIGGDQLRIIAVRLGFERERGHLITGR